MGGMGTREGGGTQTWVVAYEAWGAGLVAMQAGRVAYKSGYPSQGGRFS